MEQGFDRAERQTEALGGLLIGFVFHIEQNDGLAIAFRQLVEQLADADRRGIVRVLGAPAPRPPADCSSSSVSSETCGRRLRSSDRQAFLEIA